MAVVDIGTNSTRLLIADVAADGTVAEVEREAAVTRLGEGVEATGRLGIATEIYNLDPFYADALAKAGLEYMGEHPWSVHITVDGSSFRVMFPKDDRP